jgi:hypothetical protein
MAPLIYLVAWQACSANASEDCANHLQAHIGVFRRHENRHVPQTQACMADLRLVDRKVKADKDRYACGHQRFRVSFLLLCP